MNKRDRKESIIKNNFNVKLFLIASIIITSFGAISYGAIFLTDTQEGENNITSGCFDTKFTSGSSISLTGGNAYPISDEAGIETNPYHFEITNTCSVESVYYIILSTKSNSFSNSYVRYSISNSVPKTLGNSRINDLYDVENGYTNSYIIGTGVLGTDDKESYNLNLWIEENTTYENVKDQSWEGEVKVVSSVASLNQAEFNPDFGTDTSNANAPKLVDNLIPVVYDETIGEWIKASSEQSHWYNYDKQIWANAVTVSENTRELYKNAIIGTVIPINAIRGMYVWVPRYEYDVDSVTETINGNNVPQTMNINFIKGVSVQETNGSYIIHPAFRDGSRTYKNSVYETTSPYQMGGWSEEIEGFWFAKFETGGASNRPEVKPNIRALTNYSIIESYNIAKSASDYQGIEMDSHMAKNSEWGAVSILTESEYGRIGNNLNTSIYPNNSTELFTGRSLGRVMGETDLSLGTYEYNNPNALGSSTTGNIYGIYDMAGGAHEYVMAINRGNLESNVSIPDESNVKYYDIYSFVSDSETACGGLKCYGHALEETENWYRNVETIYNDTTHPWLTRGGDYTFANELYGGMFYYNFENGTANETIGFRIVLI